MAARAAGTMTTAIDTNVVVALWDRDPTLSLAAQTALEAAFSRGSLVVSAPVFAELAKPSGATPGGRFNIMRNAGANSVIQAVDAFLLTF